MARGMICVYEIKMRLTSIKLCTIYNPWDRIGRSRSCLFPDRRDSKGPVAAPSVSLKFFMNLSVSLRTSLGPEDFVGNWT